MALAMIYANIRNPSEYVSQPIATRRANGSSHQSPSVPFRTSASPCGERPSKCQSHKKHEQAHVPAPINGLVKPGAANPAGPLSSIHTWIFNKSEQIIDERHDTSVPDADDRHHDDHIVPTGPGFFAALNSFDLTAHFSAIVFIGVRSDFYTMSDYL
ncbi:MAG: hypothetical protein AB7F89_25725 [Pirellulaceae bacterium]